MAPPTDPRAAGHLRVGLLSARFSLLDAQLAADFPDRMRAAAVAFADRLGQRFEVVYPGLIETEADAQHAAGALSTEVLDLLVIAPTMAVPPGLLLRVLGGAAAPLLIWNALDLRALPDGLTQAEATAHTTTVGCLMVANSLGRIGRPATVITTTAGNSASFDVLDRTALALASAGSLRGRTVLRVGLPVPGYADIEASEAELAQLGLHERSVTRDELNAAVGARSAADATSVLDEAADAHWSRPESHAGDIDARLAGALEDLTDEARAICGTVNCHGDLFRSNPQVGIAACFGVARLTQQGRPFSCTGDQPTAIALYLMRVVAGAALYCECYAPEPETNLLLLVAGGEADPAWCSADGQISLVPNVHYPGLNGPGLSLTFPPALGPATLMSLSPRDGTWVLVWATGELVESRFPSLRGPNVMFRFDSPDSRDVVHATSRWIGSGATHHNALGPGRLDIEMSAIAAALNIRSVRV